MALYTIIRIYQVPADNRIEATDRMLEALSLGVEKDFNVRISSGSPTESRAAVSGSP